MLRPDVCAAGVRDLDKVPELNYGFETVRGPRYEFDGDRDFVYLEPKKSVSGVRATRATFRKRGLDRRFAGQITGQLRAKTQPQFVGL